MTTTVRHEAAAPDGLASRFARLHPATSLVFDRSACLPLQSPHLSCERCADACPAAVLHLGTDALTLDDGCLRCGRCASACPTGALRVPGFTVAVAAAPPLQVDCWKVPAEESPAGALRVPCLGGVTVSQWLALAAAGEPHGVVALDRGWCGQCNAGAGNAHPARASLDSARHLLAALALPEAMLPRIEPRPLPLSHMPRAIADRDPAAKLGRRRFLKSLGQQAIATAVEWRGDDTPGSAPARLRPGALRAPEHEARLLWLATIARRRGRGLPAGLFSQVTISAQCRNHRVCAALCPTGALARYEDADASGVAFDAWSCIGCGACARACPEQALRLSTAHTAPTAARVLTRHRLAECLDCGAPFARRAAENLCPACDKTHASFAPFLAGRSRTTNPSTS